MAQREIKFRAWHPEKMQMFSPEEMGLDQLTILPDGRGFINVSSVDTRLSQLVPMIPMQYTGLKDKNGKEIYECDVVTCVTKNELRYPHKGHVEYLDGQFSINVTEQEGDDRQTYTYFWCVLDVEVIGNIYQQPA